MVSIIESEQIGNALNILEAINKYFFSKIGKPSINQKFFMYKQIEKVIEFIDKVVV